SVRAAIAALRGRAKTYVLVSTVSVFAAFQDGGAEDAKTWDPGTATVEQAGPELYGPRKRACELALAAWDGPSCVARPCVVAGPHDPTDRFTYWPVRLARGGRVAVPGLSRRLRLALGREIRARRRVGRVSHEGEGRALRRPADVDSGADAAV